MLTAAARTAAVARCFAAVATLLVLCALLLLAAAPAASQERHNFRFHHLGLEDGLSQASVNAILQDRRGFMWFATQEGLNRFDGYDFRVFSHDPQDPGSLSHDWIWALAEDPDGALWVGTFGEGLNRLNPRDGTFTRFRNDPTNPESLSHDNILALLVDSSNTLWVGTDGGLNRFDRRSGTFTRYAHDPSTSRSLANDRVRALLEDHAGVLWVGTDGGGLARLDRATGTFTHFRHDPDDPESLSDDRVRSLYEDRNGALWVGTYQAGLARFDRETSRFTHFVHDPAKSTGLCHDRVRALLEDDRGALWAGTDGGLSVWDPQRERFTCHRRNPADAASLGDNRIMSLYVDAGGVMWIGSRGGLDRWSPVLGSFLHYRQEPSDPLSLSGNAINAFAESPDATLWVGVYDAGIDRLDRERGQVTNYRHDPGDPRSLSDDRVMSLLVDRQGALWVGTMTGGLDRLDPGSRRFVHYRHDPGDPTSLAADGVPVIYEDRRGVLWVGTYGGGLDRYDRARDRFLHYRHGAEPTSLSSDRVIALHEDSDGNLWVGTDDGGLNRFDRRSATFSHYRHDAANPESLSSDTVMAIHEDVRGVLWIGTRAGLNRWDPEARQRHQPVFQRYGPREGLPSSAVFGILEDEEGSLWLSTNRGLTRFDPLTESFRNYDSSNGLQSNEFNQGAAYRSPRGELFFGGINGFNAFFPQRVRINQHVPPVVLTSVMKLDQRVELASPGGDPSTLTLDWRDYVVSFEFSALDFTAPEKNRYRYKLEGFDDGWIELGGVRRATYTNLSAGHYTFRVAASNNDGIWNEEGIALPVHVVPPPWRSWWAHTLYGLLLAAGLFAYTRAQGRRLALEAQHSRNLEDEVEERTRQLAQRNAELEALNRRLEEVSLTDSLTGLRNRRYVANQIHNDLALVDRYCAQLERDGEISGASPDLLVLMMDLDGLKQVNDSYGHAAGDRALLQIRDILRRVCRDTDTVVRWGGDEFMVLGRRADRHNAERLAERIRSAVADRLFDFGNRTGHLTCSIGFAFYPFELATPRLISWEQVVAVADRGLYAAKKSGRNAWVGILSRSENPPDDLYDLLQHAPEELARSGVIELRTSLPVPDKLAWKQG